MSYVKRYGNFNIDEKNIIQQKNHLKKIKLTNEKIDYIVVSNVNNLSIEQKIELNQKNKNTNEITDFLSTYFKLDYASTCHSSQGLTIDEPITIFDSNTCYGDREYVYTAVSRVRSTEQLTIFCHSNDEVNNFYDSRIKQYFNLKIPNYMQQDKKRLLNYNIDDYIDTKWIYEQIDKQHNKCLLCFAPFETFLNENNIVKSNVTVDRISNCAAHIKNNCQLLCNTCNCTKK